jgi:mono/diheme cytochrome c family protein
MKPAMTLLALGIMLLSAAGAAIGQSSTPSYSLAQATGGAKLYTQKCLLCHGPELGAGQFAPSLKGVRFRRSWGGKSVGELFDYLRHNMPPGKATSLSPDQHAEILAYILQGNGVVAGGKPLPAKAEEMTTPFPR